MTQILKHHFCLTFELKRFGLNYEIRMHKSYLNSKINLWFDGQGFRSKTNGYRLTIYICAFSSLISFQCVQHFGRRNDFIFCVTRINHNKYGDASKSTSFFLFPFNHFQPIRLKLDSFRLHRNCEWFACRWNVLNASLIHNTECEWNYFR